MGFFSQEYWTGLPFPSPGDLPEPGIELVSIALVGSSLPLSHQGSPRSLHKHPQTLKGKKAAPFFETELTLKSGKGLRAAEGICQLYWEQGVSE